MEIWHIILIVIGCIFVIFLSTTTILSAVLNSVAFIRQDKEPEFKYFTAEDFNLNTEDIEVTYKGEQLYSKIYSVKPIEECERVVIFQHGFGAGSSSYMTEIATLASYGYAVIATDAYGCNNSTGKTVGGFFAGTEAVIATYIGVKRDERLKDKKVVLVGHSWGAYSVCCAANKVKVDGVVALSGFNAPAQCICDQLKMIAPIGKLMAPVLHPIFFLLNLFRSSNGNTHAATALKKSGVKALLIHGEKDRTVRLNHSVAKKAEGENVTKLILADKKHNPYNTVEAEEYLAKLLSFDGKDENFLVSYDWSKATQEDSEVMSNIDNFIKSI
ncbi:MAG: alpha/beta hydrolase family protein [Candidatus Coproplasma sp.]